MIPRYRSVIYSRGLALVSALALASILIAGSLASMPVQAAPLNRLADAGDPVVRITTVTATRPIYDPAPADGLSKTIYFNNVLSGELAVTFAISGTPSLTLTAGAAFQVPEQAFASTESPWTPTLLYTMTPDSGDVFKVTYAVTNANDLRQSVAVTYVRDVTAPVLSGLGITVPVAAKHLYAVGTTLYYTDTGGSGEYFTLHGRALDAEAEAGYSATLFSLASLNCLTFPPASTETDWSAEYCLRTWPPANTTYLTATSFDHLGNAAAAVFTVTADGTPPVSAVTAPVTEVVGQAPIALTWVATDTQSGLSRVALYSKTNQGNWEFVSSTAASGNHDMGVFTFTPA
jgi:hypothetical protein